MVPLARLLLLGQSMSGWLAGSCRLRVAIDSEALPSQSPPEPPNAGHGLNKTRGVGVGAGAGAGGVEPVAQAVHGRKRLSQEPLPAGHPSHRVRST